MSVNVKTSEGLKKIAGSGGSTSVSAALIIAALGYTPATKSEVVTLQTEVKELQDKIAWKNFS